MPFILVTINSAIMEVGDRNSNGISLISVIPRTRATLHSSTTFSVQLTFQVEGLAFFTDLYQIPKYFMSFMWLKDCDHSRFENHRCQAITTNLKSLPPSMKGNESCRNQSHSIAGFCLQILRTEANISGQD
jgi:hypothetical protein